MTNNDSNSKARLKRIIREKNISVYALVKIIENNISDEIPVLNKMAHFFWENNMKNYVIPLLMRSMEIDSNCEETVYILVKILLQLDEKQLALTYKEQLKSKSLRIEKLFDDL